MKQMINFHIAILLMLVRKTIWNEDVHAGMFGEKIGIVKDGEMIECSGEIWRHITERDWEQIMKLASRHVIRAIAYDGVCAFGWELPRKIKISWALNVEKIEEQYATHVKSAVELAELFDTSKIEMTLLKGIGLSLNYPIPNHRECGDIDIYLSDYEKGNAIASEMGLEVNVHYEKHSSFFWNKIDIENHQYFLNEQIFKVDKVFDSYLRRVMDELQLGRFADTKILLPPADFNALFLIRHQISHVLLGLNLRHLLDYTMFFYQHHKSVNFDALQRILKEQHLDKIVLGMNEVTRQYLGLKENYFTGLGIADDIVCKKVNNYLFGNVVKYKKYKNNAWGVFCEKFDKVMTDVSLDCRLLHNENPAILLMRIIFRQLGRPTEVFKK